MRHFILLIVSMSFACTVFGQKGSENIFSRFYKNQISPKSDLKEAQIYTEISPQFFFFKGFAGALGAEFSRLQVGFIYLRTPLTPPFRDAIFNNAETLDIPANGAVELSVNVFLRKDRKGFYVGSILSYDWYAVEEVSSGQKDFFNKSYLVFRAGFRWFPFKEHFYIDGGYGLSLNLDGPATRTLGNTTYSHKTILGLPFFAVGLRVSLVEKACD